MNFKLRLKSSTIITHFNKKNGSRAQHQEEGEGWGVRVGKKGERDPGQRAGGGEWGTAYNAGIGGGGEVGSGANKSAPGCQRVEQMERARRANHGDCCQERGFGHRRAPKSFFKKRQGRTDGC